MIADECIGAVFIHNEFPSQMWGFQNEDRWCRAGAVDTLKSNENCLLTVSMFTLLLASAAA